MQRVCVWVHLRAVDYLAQMMVIAINETMHTPPTKEPAISESCCPSSDLYSSTNVHTHKGSYYDVFFHYHAYNSHTHTHTKTHVHSRTLSLWGLVYI